MSAREWLVSQGFLCGWGYVVQGGNMTHVLRALNTGVEYVGKSWEEIKSKVEADNG